MFNFQIVAVLVGINNIPRDSPDQVVKKYDTLISDILSLNPGWLFEFIS